MFNYILQCTETLRKKLKTLTILIKDGRFRMVPAPTLIPIPPWHSDSDSGSDSTKIKIFNVRLLSVSVQGTVDSWSYIMPIDRYSHTL